MICGCGCVVTSFCFRVKFTRLGLEPETRHARLHCHCTKQDRAFHSRTEQSIAIHSKTERRTSFASARFCWFLQDGLHGLCRVLHWHCIGESALSPRQLRGSENCSIFCSIFCSEISWAKSSWLSRERTTGGQGNPSDYDYE